VKVALIVCGILAGVTAAGVLPAAVISQVQTTTTSSTVNNLIDFVPFLKK
jgi:hypothetical protein